MTIRVLGIQNIYCFEREREREREREIERRGDRETETETEKREKGEGGEREIAQKDICYITLL